MRRFRVSTQGRNGIEQLTTVSNNPDTEVLQVLRRQVRQDLLVDRVLAECRLILFEAKAPQPTPDIHESAIEQRTHLGECERCMTVGMSSGRGSGRDQFGRPYRSFLLPGHFNI
jgi:hypothetical protein